MIICRLFFQNKVLRVFRNFFISHALLILSYHSYNMHLEHTGELNLKVLGHRKYRRYVILKLISLPRKQNVPKELFQGYLPF